MESKLLIKDEEQRNAIKDILGSTSFWFSGDNDEGVHIDDWISFDEMAKIVDYLRNCDSPKEKKDALFEECWLAYRRKGSKRKAKEYWSKLPKSAKDIVLPHIKAYVSTRELSYQKDFERYLRDKIFSTIVVQGDKIVYDPNNVQSGVYSPQLDGNLRWNNFHQCYVYIGMFIEQLVDGYTNDTRPDGAKIVLNNARGTIIWNSQEKKWIKMK